MKHIYVVIDETNKNDKVQGIMGVWTSKRQAIEQARFLRTNRQKDCIHTIEYTCTIAKYGYWFKAKYTQEPPF